MSNATTTTNGTMMSNTTVAPMMGNTSTTSANATTTTHKTAKPPLPTEPSQPTCTIDTSILNPTTLPEMQDIALSFFASACGKNRGAFVLDPPDGQTYGCLNLPQDFPTMAGATDMLDGIDIDNANDIKEQFEGGNITAPDALAMLDFLVRSVYAATPNKAATPYACEFNGLAKLECSASSPIPPKLSPRTDGAPIRAVNLAGLYVPALWATGGQELSLHEASAWYTAKDFRQMHKVGLNTVQISIPTAAFTPGDKYGALVKASLEQLLPDIDASGLQVILNLVSTADEEDAVVAAAQFAQAQATGVILGLALPQEMKVATPRLISAIRVQAPTVNLFVPMNEGDLVKVSGEFDDKVFGALELSHSATIGDIASSSSVEDRSKLFYHEATACVTRSPLEYAACFQDMPIFMSSGFDLSVDDCVNQDIPSSGFQDYGQCSRFNETTTSGWWFRHRASFAARQVFAYEQGLGWSFATWKLYDNGDDDTSSTPGVIDVPAKLLSLSDVVEAGLFPDLKNETAFAGACLNPPEPDFVMGDETYAPTMGPPPDCGNGWWNYTTEQCDYWIPPTPAPTKGCPVCSEEDATAALGTSGALMLGIIMGGLLTALVMNRLGYGKRSDYMRIPN